MERPQTGTLRKILFRAAKFFEPIIFTVRKSKALVTSLCSHSPGQQQENYPNDLALYKENNRNNAWEKGCRKSVIKCLRLIRRTRIIQENILKHGELFSGQLLDFGFENSHSRLHKLICYVS